MMYIKIAAGFVRSYPRKIINNLIADYQHDLGKKYLNSFKAAALSKKYKFIPKNFDSDLNMPLRY